MWLKVSPMKGVIRFGKKGKLAPRYIGPFQILARVGNVAYQLELPQELGHIHDVFHVSLLKKYVPSSKQIEMPASVPVAPNLSYEEEPNQFLARDTRKLRSRWISMIKVQWSNHTPEEATWEVEPEIAQKYPQLYERLVRNLEDQIL